jgi:ABC-type bacteriocin/lantibiotic exporter with double-glycine peptidase domain
MNSVERILEYIKKGGHEASWIDPKPSKDWPILSQYEAKDVRFRYRPELPQVIKGITFNISIKLHYL